MLYKTPSPQFTQLIANNIALWQETAQSGRDDYLQTEHQNVYKAVEMGLQVETTALDAADLLVTLASFVERYGYWQAWLPLWRRALENQAGSPKRWQIQTRLAFFHRMNGEYDLSVTLLREVLEHLHPEEDEAVWGQTQFHLGHGLFYLKQYDEARRHAQIAFTVFERHPDAAKGGVAPAQNLLGLIHLSTGSSEAAVQLFQEARRGWRQSGHPEYVFIALLNEALAFAACQQFTDAMNCYQQAVLYAEEGDHLLTKTQVYLNMGTLLLSQGRWEKAQTVYLQIDRNALFQLGHIDAYTRLITNLGHVSMELGNLETAVSHLQEAVSLWRQLEDAVMLANALDSLGDTYLRQRQPAAARACYREGLTLVRQHPDDHTAQQLQTTLTRKLDTLHSDKKRATIS